MLLLLSILLISPFAKSWSPTDSYAPGNVSCPEGVATFVRPASSLSENEQDWVSERHKITDQNLIDFLDHANLTDFNAENFINSLNSSISIGVAFSGGGYRAMFSGAGQLSGLDNRTTGAWEHGLGGLLESTTYFSGLSGGNWLLGTVAYNNWTSVQEIMDDGVIWDIDHSFIDPYFLEIFKDFDYWVNIFDTVDEKKDAGFDVSLTDPWGRALSFLFFPTLDNSGAALTVSTLRDAPVFLTHQMPFPIHVSDGRTPGSYIIDSNSTIFEITPFELGSWDPSLYAFTDVKYLGTKVENGVPTTDTCVGGFDNAGFIMGCSSSLFNEVVIELNTSSVASDILTFEEQLSFDINKQYYDIGLFDPNPFYKTKYANVDAIAESDTLYLVDGGEDGQNVPLAPLIQPEREVDIIFAFDNSADENNYPDGTSLVHTYNRQFSEQGNGTTFPYVPSTDVFLKQNLTKKPTFFGCDSKNLTSLNHGIIPPLVVYIGNTDMSYDSNKSTYQLAYDESERRSMIKNGFETVTRMNMTLDADWRSCVACAIIRRSEERADIEQSEQCKECFEEYCWDGSLD